MVRSEHGGVRGRDSHGMQSSQREDAQRKRRRSVSRGPLDPSSPYAGDGESDGMQERESSIPPSSLPASSPPGALSSDLNDESEEPEERSVVDDEEMIRDVDDGLEEEDDEGEDLFGDNLEAYVQLAPGSMKAGLLTPQ